MKLTEYLRIRLRCGSKYTLCVVDGTEEPHLHHEDAYRTDYYTGRRTNYAKTYGGRKWNTYHAAVNEIRVGSDWIQSHFPGWKKNADISDEQISYAEYADQVTTTPTAMTRSERWAIDAEADEYRPSAKIDCDLTTQGFFLAQYPSRKFNLDIV